MCISEKDQIQNFLKEKTFICTRYNNARISHRTCLINSARAYHKKLQSDKIKRTNHDRNYDQGESSKRLESILLLAQATCLGCSKYEKPTKELLNQVAPKHGNRPRFGRLLYGNSLPKTSPEQNTTS